MLSPLRELTCQWFSNNSTELRIVVYSLIVSRIAYALPAWGGFVSVELKGKIDAMFKRLRRYGYINDNLTL